MAMNPELEAKLRAAANANAAANRAKEAEIKNRVTKAIEAERSGDLETAFKGYTSLYNQGFVPAAFYLGNLYMHRGFRATEEKNEQTGQIIRRPDLKSALSWYRKAADRGIREAMCNAGVMLVTGQGCEKDTEAGKRYLLRARDAGSEEARSFLFQNFADQRSSVTYTDEEYSEMLTKFIGFSGEANAQECHKLFFKLVCGNDEQLSSLGTVLALHKYSTRNPFVNRMNQNSYPKLSNGMPCVPLYIAKRLPGASTLHLNTRCFPEGKIRLTLCSSIEDLTLFPLSGIEDVEDGGVITYTASPFGNMPATRSARIMEFTVEENAEVCIFTENGDKEYLVEFGWLDENNQLHFLFRYAVDIRAADVPGVPTVLSITAPGEEPAGNQETEQTLTKEEPEVAAETEEIPDSSSSEPRESDEDAEKEPEKKGLFKKIFKKNP
ncbi:MAG: tetratricopeptide repeat protein [Eubacteriales bacterium]